MRYRAVFFDAGDTLLSPHPSFSEIFAEVLRDHGHHVRAEDVDEALASVGSNFVEILDRTGSPTWSTSREISRRFWRTIYQVAFEELGLEDTKQALFEALYERFTRFDTYQLFPDALPTLRTIKQAGLLMGLISNFEEWLEEMLVSMEVSSLFELLVISGKEGVEKPDPAIFRLALDRAAVPAEEALHVGDHPRLDAQAALAAGMAAVLIDRRGHYPEYEGLRITGLDELLPLIGL